MSVNKENYELYFLDYHEGRLSAAEQAELMDFLARHPELKQEFDDFEQLTLVADPDHVFPDKESMKRGGITKENSNYYLAAYVSGDLGADEASAVEAFVAGDKKMARELELMKLTVLKADTDIVFADKESLKHPLMTVAHGMGASVGAEPVRRYTPAWYYTAAAAAVVLLMAGLFFLRLPDITLQEYAEEIPAVGDEEPTLAVVEVPSLREEALPAREPEPLPVSTATDPVLRPPTKSVQATRPEARPLLAARMPQKAPQPLQAKVNIMDASAPDPRTDFAGWHLRQGMPGSSAPVMAASQPTETTLVQYAANQLQQAVPIDRDEIGRQLTNTRSSIRELADQGLGGIGILAVNALGVETTRDEAGRLQQFAIGDLFAITRK
jgi:hypothetical protein